MKKAAILLTAAAAGLSWFVSAAVPKALESSAPVSETLRAETRTHIDTVYANGSLVYLGQNEITSTLPLVVEKFTVKAGDTVNIGDEIASVDKKASAALIESLGQVRALAVPASELAAAVALLPETIVSDCAGRVVSTAAGGKAIQSGSSIASVAQTDSPTLTAAISELEIAAVSVGQKARFTLTAYPDEVFYGTVTGIASAARDQYNGAVLETVVDVSITPDADDERLKPGLSAEAEILLGEPREICVVPYSAIGQDERSEYVYVYEDGKAVRRDIKTGAEFSGGAEAVSGITSDDVIFKNPDEIAGRSHIRVAAQ